MRKLVPLLLTGVLAAAVISVLADRLQNRRDVLVPGTHSIVTFDVDVYDTEQPIDRAAEALWHACNQTVPSHLESLRIADDGNGVATLTPAMGPHDRKRLTGCLHDATLDRMRGDVISVVDEPPN